MGGAAFALDVGAVFALALGDDFALSFASAQNGSSVNPGGGRQSSRPGGGRNARADWRAAKGWRQHSTWRRACSERCAAQKEKPEHENVAPSCCSKTWAVSVTSPVPVHSRSTGILGNSAEKRGRLEKTNA